jgi:hypothetical protein
MLSSEGGEMRQNWVISIVILADGNYSTTLQEWNLDRISNLRIRSLPYQYCKCAIPLSSERKEKEKNDWGGVRRALSLLFRRGENNGTLGWFTGIETHDTGTFHPLRTTNRSQRAPVSKSWDSNSAAVCIHGSQLLSDGTSSG